VAGQLSAENRKRA